MWLFQQCTYLIQCVLYWLHKTRNVLDELLWMLPTPALHCQAHISTVTMPKCNAFLLLLTRSVCEHFGFKENRQRAWKGWSWEMTVINPCSCCVGALAEDQNPASRPGSFTHLEPKQSLEA